MGIEDRKVGADAGISSVLCMLGVFLVGGLAGVDGHSPAERRGWRDRWGSLVLRGVNFEELVLTLGIHKITVMWFLQPLLSRQQDCTDLQASPVLPSVPSRNTVELIGIGSEVFRTFNIEFFSFNSTPVNYLSLNKFKYQKMAYIAYI